MSDANHSPRGIAADWVYIADGLWAMAQRHQRDQFFAAVQRIISVSQRHMKDRDDYDPPRTAPPPV